MTRIALGMAALSLAALTACGTTPGTTPTPAPTSPPTTGTAAPTATPASPSPDGTATATVTPNGTATPGGTATASPTTSPTPGARAVSLPERMESFQRVEQRTENDVRIGAYYSDSLKTVVEVHAVRNRAARDLLTSLGGMDPASVGPALCSTRGDTICAQERNRIAVAVVAKELPATMVATLTTQFGDAVD